MSGRWLVGQTKTLSTTVTNNGTLTDAADITFKYKIGRHGQEVPITPSHASLGVYYVEVTPDKSGNLYCRWDTDGALDVASEPIYIIRRSSFEEITSNDYN
jgi:hypothetical protein